MEVGWDSFAESNLSPVSVWRRISFKLFECMICSVCDVYAGYIAIRLQVNCNCIAKEKKRVLDFILDIFLINWTIPSLVLWYVG